ncbi:MAG: PqqD family peptide modification chaperone, partial [Acidimicrobiales bacterium]
MTAPTYTRSDGALWHRTSRRAVVLSPGGDVLDLVGTAALVWDALAEPVTAEELAGDLAEVFG